jgi:hypothetical protein
MQQVDAGERHSLSISNGWFLQVYNWTGLSNDENSQDVAFPYRTFIELTEMLIQY